MDAVDLGELRAHDFGYLDAEGHTYLDYTGAGLAPTSLALVIARFAQGASAAFVAPQALALLTDLFAEGHARTRALGIFQGATAAGASAGIAKAPA